MDCVLYYVIYDVIHLILIYEKYLVIKKQKIIDFIYGKKSNVYNEKKIIKGRKKEEEKEKLLPSY